MTDESNVGPLPDAGGTTAGPEAGGTPASGIRGLHSSTPLPTLQHRGGEDTIEVFAWVKWSDAWTETVQKLETLQKKAQEDGFQFLDVPLPNSKDTECWQVHRTGFKCGGDKGSGPGYSFRLTYAGCTFGLQRVIEPAETATVGNVKVRFGSEFLIDVGGIEPAWKWLEVRIAALGGVITQNLLSLVDPCVDLVDVPVEVFCAALREERFISRWQARGQWGDGPNDNSFRLGSHGKMIRVYDKVLEVRHQPTKEVKMIERRWNMRIPKAATRVEFSLGRCFLKEYGLDTVEQWIKNRGGICAKLCTEYVRFTSGKIDRRHTERATILPEWKLVTDAFAGWTGTGEAERVESERQPDVTRLLKQAWGCLLAANALKGRQAQSDSQLRRDVFDLLFDPDIMPSMTRVATVWKLARSAHPIVPAVRV